MADTEPAAVVLAASELHIRITDKLILDHQDIILREGDRAGLIGRNGEGKSTILRVIAGEEEHYAGDISTRRETRVSYLPQEVNLQSGLTVREAIMQGGSDILAMIEQLHALPPGDARATALDAAITACEGWQLDHRLEVLASSLSAPPLTRDVDTLSGGEKRRVALCRTLLSHPDLLLLDEPTNHLDTESIEWLETYLARYQGTCLFVTHDRAFLDHVATRMLELSQGQLYSYTGNYSDFLRKKAKRQAVAEQEENRRLSYIRREADWIHRGPKARGTKAQARIDRFNEAVNQSALQREEDIDIIIPPAPRLSNRVVTFDHVTVDVGERTLIRDFSFDFEPGMRIGVVGRNGMGKTTLLRAILGEVEPTEGEVIVGERTMFNYADQHRLVLDDTKTVFEEIGEGNDFVQLGPHRLGLWAYLKRFLFTDDEIHTRIDQLSGGERSRLVLAKILKRGGNVLLLDEPTNDLDLSTLRVLETALSDFGGCVVIVSHDRYLLNRVCTGIFGFEGEGEVVYQPGDYTYYLAKKQERQQQTSEQEKEPSQQKSAPAESRQPRVRKLKWKEERELEEMEDAVLEAEEHIQKLEELFSQEDFFEKHGHETQTLTAELEEAREKLERLFTRWEELEAIKNGDVREQRD